MYESTPQHVIDEESFPGLLADMLGSSSSSDSSGSSSDTDSDGSSGSNTTAKRIKRVLRGRRRRKSSVSSKDTPSMPSAPRSPSIHTHNSTFEAHQVPVTESKAGYFHYPGHSLGAIASGDEADTDGEHDGRRPGNGDAAVNFRDFESEKAATGTKSPDLKRKKKSKKKHHKAARHDTVANESEKNISPSVDGEDTQPPGKGSGLRVGFVQSIQAAPEPPPKGPFNIRGLATVPRMLSSTVFSAANPTGPSTTGGPQPGVTVPRAPYGLRRTSSLPDRLIQAQPSAPSAPSPCLLPVGALGVPHDSKDDKPPKKYMSRTTAILLLLVSTGLVAVCAEFLVSSINYLVDNTGVSQAFVGLIILPIVGNAAEHVTAVTVASKNKMDLAIGVAVGSSIQIALFVTPVIVLLGWILGKDMSLYFTLFETVSLFVSAFIVNFLVLDGRSNYLEGALLIAAYVIIAVAAFYYPELSQQSTVGGAAIGTRMLSKLV